MMEAMALVWYELWYKENVAPNLSEEEKKAVAKRISDLSLQEPIFQPGFHYPLDAFPELKPFSNTDQFTGMQLYAVLTEVAKELGFNTPSASDIAFKKGMTK